MAPPTGRRSRVAGLLTVSGAIVTSILPAFLLGALSVRIRRDLGHGEAVAGVVFASFFAASAVVSARLGRWVDRAGPRTGFALALSGTTVVQLAVAAVARDAATLALLAAAAGVCNAASQLSANVFIAGQLPARRQGIGFAVKQSAMPGASLLAGLALPLLAERVGWRGAFCTGAGLSAIALVATAARLPRIEQPAVDVDGDAGADPAPPRHEPRGGAALTLLAVAAALATGAAVTLGGFFVESSIDAGVADPTAGLAFAAGSLVSVVVRLVVGQLADRRRGDLLGVVAGMILLGAAISALFTWRDPVVHLVGVPLAFGAGWAWPGLFNLSVVRAWPSTPGRATGVTQTGTYVGGAVGPVLFGVVAQLGGFAAAWWLAAGIGVAAAVTVLRARTLLRGGRRSGPRDGATRAGGPTLGT